MSYEYDGFGDMVWVDDPASDANTGGSGAGGNGSGNDGSGVVANTGAGDSTDANGWTTDELGIPYKINANGSPSFMNDKGTEYSWNATKGAFTDTAGNIAGDQRTFLSLAKKMLVNADGTLKPNVIGAIGGGLLGAIGALNPTINKVGYQGGLPALQAQRTMATAPVAGRRPGEGGTNYGGEVKYSPAGIASAAPAAPVQTVHADTNTVNPWANKMNRDFATAVNAEPETTTTGNTTAGTNVMTPAQLAAAQNNYQIINSNKASTGVMPDTSAERKYLADFAALGGTGGIPDIAAAQAAKDKAAGQTQIEKAIPGSNIGTGGNDPGDMFNTYPQYRGVIDGGFNQFGVGAALLASLAGTGDKSKLPNSGSDSFKSNPTYDPGYPPPPPPGAQPIVGPHQVSPVMPKLNFPGETMADVLAAQNQTVKAAQGGIMGLAHGGRYLQGNTDGMADKLHTSIDNKQPAALSHGEFVIPADVVSHLGNGNSDAGAKKLYQMMDKIRQARTGTKQQGKQINPDKFMPGGLAQAYATGGSVQHFATGDVVPAGTTGVDQTLASWTGNYAPNMLAQTQALTSTAMPQYTGTLTAGASDLQNQAFAGASENAQAGYTPTSFTSGTFDTSAANQYMNPYLQASLDPQIAEARRQSDITAQQNNAQMTKAGAFGGGRNAILTAENQRNLGTNLAGIVGTGYNTAFNNAQQQFNAEQNRGLDTQKASEASRQYGADYGIKALNQAADLGATQRGITSEGVAADKKAFEDARNAPYDQLKFQSQMLAGLPIQATNYSTALPSTAQQTLAGAGGVAGLLGNKTSYTMDDVTAAMRKLGFNV